MAGYGARQAGRQPANATAGPFVPQKTAHSQHQHTKNNTMENNNKKENKEYNNNKQEGGRSTSPQPPMHHTEGRNKTIYLMYGIPYMTTWKNKTHTNQITFNYIKNEQ